MVWFMMTVAINDEFQINENLINEAKIFISQFIEQIASINVRIYW